MSRAFVPHHISDDSALGGSVIERSLRVNDNDSAYLSRTPSSAGNRRTFTISVWTKRANLTGALFGSYISDSDRATLRFSSDYLEFQSSGGASVKTNAVFRDSSAWYHIVCAIDTTQGTQSNRGKLYVNGVQAELSSNSFSQDVETSVNNNSLHVLGTRWASDSANMLYDGYLAEVNLIDGLQLDPSYFGYTESQTGIWRPKKYVGAYGTNGFLLDFSDSSAIGYDNSGNGNSFTVTNFVATDVLKDTPTNNFATYDPLAESGGTYSEGNLKVVSTADSASSTIGFASGKFYYEVYVDATSAMYVGVIPIDFGLNPARGGSWDHGAIAYKFNGDQYSLKQGQSSVSASYGASYTAGDIIGCAVDIDNDTVTFYKNGVSQGNTTNGVSYISPTGAKDGIYGAIVYCNGGNNIMIVNYGQDSTFQGTVSAGGNKDASGLGDFKYPVPSGYRALCSNNLPVNTTSLINPKKHFDTLLWTGNGSASHRITGLEFKPDLVWLKCRSHTKWFILVDSVRGNDKNISSNEPDAEFAETHIPSFNENGITVADIDSGTANENSYTYVAWCWKAGGAAVSNSDGSITSSVSVNQEAGFSIVTFTGTGSAATVGHGLGKAPDVVITKRRNAAQSWFIHHKDLSNGHYIRLDGTNAQGGDTNVYPNNMSTANTFAVGGDSGVNGSGDTYVSYCWHSVPGYSKFGTYEGNGNANGPFVFTGFRPAMIFYKRIDGSDNWGIHDNKRDVDNPIQRFLYPDDTYAEWTGGTNDHFDFLSNGFKVRNAGSMLNQNNETMVYWAFAESPQTSPNGGQSRAR